ncbi:MAG: PHP domain-containing protein [Clostridia bacterium]|nr:PHP domain-containing protein [Clostridia bacterium]
MTADLHMHTVYSDGTLTPQTVVDCAESAGLGLFAVTDHDNVSAYAEVAYLAKSKGIKTVTGIEVSAYDNGIKFHTLGYGIDLEKFAPFQKKLYDGSLERAKDIVLKLNNLGFGISMEDVLAERYSSTVPVHGAHVARAMIKKGFVESFEAFFKNFLFRGKPAFSCIQRPTSEEAVRAICEAGGLAVLAHPGRIEADAETLKSKIESLALCGLGGIEVYYSTHTNEQTAYYENLAESLNLLKTGGSDTHTLGFGGRRVIGQPRFEPSAFLLKRLNVY